MKQNKKVVPNNPDISVSYQFQYRKCGKPTCKTCKEGHGHGPYWYAYWRESGKLLSAYIGKEPPKGIEVPAKKREAKKEVALS